MAGLVAQSVGQRAHPKVVPQADVGYLCDMGQQAVHKGIRGGSVTILGSAGTVVVQVASVAILSRLLAPEDFGLLAMVAVFVSLGNLIRDFGMPMAALQAKSLSHQDASNLFWVNVALAGSVGAVFAASTPAIVALFSEPRLMSIVPAMALVIVINGVGAQIQIDLARKMKFNTLVVSDLLSQGLGLLAAVGLAMRGFGYWALVAQAVVMAASSLALRWVASGWLPTRIRGSESSRKLYRTGAEYGLSHILTFLQANVDTLVIGARLGATQLGFYNRGYQLLTAPASRVLDPLTQVVITAMNGARAEGRDVVPLMLRVQFVLGALVVWVFAISGSNATAFVSLFLGPGWGETIGVFQILAIGGSVAVFSHVSYWVFILYEQSRQLLRYSLLTKPIAVVLIVAGSAFGIEGVAWGYTVAMIVNWPVNLLWLRRCVNLPSGRFAANGVMVILAGALAAVVSMVSGRYLASQWGSAALVVSIFLGTATMLGTLAVFPRGRSEIASSASLVRLMFPGRNGGV